MGLGGPEEDHQLHHCCWTGCVGEREERSRRMSSPSEIKYGLGIQLRERESHVKDLLRVEMICGVYVYVTMISVIWLFHRLGPQQGDGI